MNATRSFLLFAALSPAALLLSSPSLRAVSMEATPTTTITGKETVTGVKAAPRDTWDSNKDCTHEKRDEFAANLDRMAAKLNDSIREMNAKLTGLPDAAAKERDRASKEFNVALASLQSDIANVRTSTADTWADAKGRVSQSWQRVQVAYDNVKSSPTS